MNGCFNHAPYKDTFGSYGVDRVTGEVRYFSVPNPNSKTCNYKDTALGKADKGCVGCVWNTKPDKGIHHGIQSHVGH